MNSYLLIKSTSLIISGFILVATAPPASATQADSTSITITGQTAGPTPFINKLSLMSSDAAAIATIQFTVTPQPGSLTRPLSATYAKGYLQSRGYFDLATGQITVPVFGLYPGYSNTVALTYRFTDGSSKGETAMINTAAFDDACNFDSPTIQQARTTTPLSYDFILVGTRCSFNSPTVIDTDGKVRWVGTAGVQSYTTRFYKNGIYLSDRARLLRLELDGTVSVVGDYSSAGVVSLHHNIDLGKSGLIIDVNTPYYVESVNLEVNPFSGQILQKWNLADVIRKAMIAGGDDPTGFVRKARGRYDFDAPEDWFHNNSVTYRPYDNTLLISSRENFVIAIDYTKKVIKWILGDTTKKWYQYPSLQKFALAVAEGGLAPVGQHALSLGKDQTLLLMDNGRGSQHQFPAGPTRNSVPRKYQFNLPAREVKQVASYPNGGNIFASFCSSVYEDALENYLIDYANVGGAARILGLTSTGEKAFEYSYPTGGCEDAYRSLPIHWENLIFSDPAAVRAAETTARD